MPSPSLPPSAAPRGPQARIAAVDVFRGMTIAFMIIVNTPGSGRVSWGPLRHAAWHGFTPTDLVFPSFLFIIGVSAFFSLRRFGPVPGREAWVRIWRRTAILFGIGMLMWYVPGLVASLIQMKPGAFLQEFLHKVRVLGVLQRLALCYGIGSTLALLLSRRSLVLVSAGLLLTYWGLMAAFGTGADPYGLQTNAALRLDLALFGPDHLYHGESVDGAPYAFDPEGLLSTLPALVTFILGYLSGRFLHETQDRRIALSGLFPAALLLVAGGFLWSYWLGFPINKKIWTSSYTLYVGGLSMLLLAMTLWIVDVRGWRRGVAFFEIFGRNPLLAYVVSEMGEVILGDWVKGGGGLSGHEWLYQRLCVPVGGDTGLGSFLFSVGFCLAVWVFSWAASRKGWILKV